MRLRIIFLTFVLSIASFAYAQTGNFYNNYFQGNALYVKGQYDKAIKKYSEAIKEGNLAYVYYNRANCYFAKKDYSKAMEDYNTALQMKSDYAEAFCQRGLVKIATNDNTACDDIKKAHKLGLEDAKTELKKHCK